MIVAKSATGQAMALGVNPCLFGRCDGYRIKGKIAVVLLAPMFRFSVLFDLGFIALKSSSRAPTCLSATLLQQVRFGLHRSHGGRDRVLCRKVCQRP